MPTTVTDVMRSVLSQHQARWNVDVLVPESESHTDDTPLIGEQFKFIAKMMWCWNTV